MKALFYFILIPALLPVFLVLRYIYKKDKVEREPLGAVLITVALGAAFALLDSPIEQFLDQWISFKFNEIDSLESSLCKNIFGVGIVEEVTKWLVLMVYVWKLRDFDYRYDGIVYAVCASMGFAGIENVLYIAKFGTGISIGRAIFSIPGHASFAVFMGYYLSRAKDADIRGWGLLKLICLIFSIAVPTVIHGVYDFLLGDVAISLGYNQYFILFVIVLDILSWMIIHHEFRTDRPLGYSRRRRK